MLLSRQGFGRLTLKLVVGRMKPSLVWVGRISLVRKITLCRISCLSLCHYRGYHGKLRRGLKLTVEDLVLRLERRLHHGQFPGQHSGPRFGATAQVGNVSFFMCSISVSLLCLILWSVKVGP